MEIELLNNVEGQQSKETFEEFVNRMKNQTTKTSENQYETRVRPSTCGGYGQLRIKQQKRPSSKSGMGIKLYDEVKNYPYYK